MTENADVMPVNKDIIDGSPVILRQIARLMTPASRHEDGLSPTYGVDECLLEDGRTVFQCVHPDGLDCVYWAPKGESVRSHLRIHVLPKRKAEQDRIKAELAELQARESQRLLNYKKGAQKAAKTREQNRKNGQEQTESQVTMSADEFSQELKKAIKTMGGVLDGLYRANNLIVAASDKMEIAYASLENLADVDSLTDPELMAKADSWDAMQALLNPNNKR